MGASLPRAAEAHIKVEHCFNNSGDTMLERVATQLGRLRDRRNEADYRLSEQGVEDARTVELVLTEARRAMGTIKERSTSSDRDAIVAAIEEWSRSTQARLFPDTAGL